MIIIKNSLTVPSPDNILKTSFDNIIVGKGTSALTIMFNDNKKINDLLDLITILKKLTILLTISFKLIYRLSTKDTNAS